MAAVADHDLLTIEQVAELLSVSTWTVRRWWKQGAIPAPHRVGPRQIRWRAEDLARWIRKGLKPQQTK